MSEDQFTEVEQESWLGRIGGALTGILIGLILIVIAFPLLFWNEGRSVKEFKTLKEGGGTVLSVASDHVDPVNAGRLIHITGNADTDAVLKDPVFGVSAKAIKLKRVVEMYQWEEKSQSKTEKQIGGGKKTVKTYTYRQVWSDKHIDSSDFKNPNGHQNPGAVPYESARQTAEKVTAGAFRLSPSLVAKVDNYEPLPVTGEIPLQGPLKDKVIVHDGGFYIGADPVSPQTGNVRIKFYAAKPTAISVIAKQTGNSFEPYHTKAGGDIELLQTGIISADGMIQKAQESNKVLTWILRLVGFILLFIGLVLILRPLSVLADVLPILGDIVGAGTGIIAFLLAGILSLVTIAIAWVVYRPVLAITLIAAALCMMWTFRWKIKAAKKI